MTTWKRIISYLRPYLGRFILALVCMAGMSIVTAFSRWLIKPILDKIFIAKDLQMLYLIIVIIPLVYLLNGLFAYGQNYFMAYISQRITKTVREKLYEHLQTLSMDYFTKDSTGKIMSRITYDITIIQAAIKDVPISIVCGSLTVICLLSVLFILHWKFALLGLIIFPIAAIPITKFSQKMRKLSRQGQAQMAELYMRLQESLTAIAVTKIFTQEKEEINKFRTANTTFYNTIMRYVRTETLSSPVMEFIGAIAIAFILWYGGRDVIRDVWTTGAFFAFVGAALSFYQPLRGFVQVNPLLQSSLSAWERIFEISDIRPTVVEKANAYILPPFKKFIQYDNVSFKYDDELVINNVSLTINAGEIVAIVGPSGGGKTTLINLLLRLYDPTSGKILIDGYNIHEVKLHSLRAQIGVVPQEAILFNDSVRNNIAYGKEGAVEEEIINSAKIANAHEFIISLPQGYETVIGERGAKLSAGQKQRLAIARAIIRNPAILILDEATSALDAESERLIQETLEKVMQNRTVIIIAHRLATIKKADKIVVFDRGSILDIGTHEELCKKEGLYKHLHQLQII